MPCLVSIDAENGREACCEPGSTNEEFTPSSIFAIASCCPVSETPYSGINHHHCCRSECSFNTCSSVGSILYLPQAHDAKNSSRQRNALLYSDDSRPVFVEASVTNSKLKENVRHHTGSNPVPRDGNDDVQLASYEDIKHARNGKNLILDSGELFDINLGELPL